MVYGTETEDDATHPNVDNRTRVGHDGAGAGSGAGAGDLSGGELDLLGELVGGSCQDLQLLGQCCCCCRWLEDPQLLFGPQHGTASEQKLLVVVPSPSLETSLSAAYFDAPLSIIEIVQRCCHLEERLIFCKIS